MNAKIQSHQLETGAKFGPFNLQWLRFLYHITFGLREGNILLSIPYYWGRSDLRLNQLHVFEQYHYIAVILYLERMASILQITNFQSQLDPLKVVITLGGISLASLSSAPDPTRTEQ